MKKTSLSIILSLSFFPFILSAQDKGVKHNTAALDTVRLQEVVVSVSKPVTRFEGDGMVVKISGTVLQKLGTAYDVLGFIPGVSAVNGTVEVIGKGRPVIYVNGREMRSLNELNQLRSMDIKDITVVNNPGARYRGDTNAVIRITTVRRSGEGMAVNSRTTAGFLDYLYGKELLDLNYRSGGLDIFTTLEYDNTRSKGSSRNVQNIWTTVHDQTEILLDSRGKSQFFEGKLGFNYLSKSGHTFGVYYQGHHKPSRVRSSYVSEYRRDSHQVSGSATLQRNEVSTTRHLFDGYYSGKWGRWTADVSFDLLWKDGSDNETSMETLTGGESRDIDLHEDNSASLIAAKINLSRSLWGGKLNAGAEYTSSRREDEFVSKNDIIGNNSNTIREKSAGVYGEFSGKIGKISFQLGLRFEHTASDYYEYGTRVADQSRDYNEWLPSLHMTFPWRQSSFQLGYSRKYRQPLYSQLSGTVNFINNSLYESGNPNLRPSYSDNVTFSYSYKWIMLNASYSNVSGQIISSATMYEDNPEITLLRKINSPYSLDSFQGIVTVMPGFIGKVYYPVLSAGIVGQSYRMMYRGQIKRLDNPMGLIQFRNILRFPKALTVTAGFQWRSDAESDNISMGHSWQLDLSATKNFNRHWAVQISINDIFNSSRRNHYTVFSDAQDMYIEKTVNKRKFEVSVMYKFNTKKSRYKGKGAGQDEKERL